MSGVTSHLLGAYSHISKAFFGRHLGRSTILALKKDRVQFSYVVPNEVCKSQLLTCSAAFAIFDELSTVGLLCLDKSHRPGVSITLSTSIHNENTVKQGECVIVDIYYDKIGKTVAFTSMTMKNELDELVASGKHIKFLPISWFYDNIISIPFIYSFITRAVYNIEQNALSWLGERLLGPSDDPEVTSNLYDQIHDQFDCVTSEIDGKEVPTMMIKRKYANPFSMLHGGAAAMIVEEAVSSKHTKVESIVMNYMNGVPVNKNVSVVIDAKKMVGSHTVAGSLVTNGRVMSTFSCQTASIVQ